MVASYNTAKTVMYDMETAKPVLNFDSGSTYGKKCSLVKVKLKRYLIAVLLS